jgi:RNA polymerase sigma-70 factor, ECF subfamily
VFDVTHALELPLHVPTPFEPTATARVATGTGSADTRLVEAARGGDRAAFGELYRAYVRMVHGVLLASVPPGDVDDLVQDVFVSAMRRLDTLRQPAAFPGWLATIARNRAADFHRRRPLEREALPEEVPAPDEDRTEALAVLAVVRRLPDTYRETLVLRLVEGMTGEEIAARTGLTPGSVRVNLHRGLKLLRARLEEGSVQR